MPFPPTIRRRSSRPLCARRRGIAALATAALLCCFGPIAVGEGRDDFLSPAAEPGPVVAEELPTLSSEDAFAAPPPEENVDGPFAVVDGENAVVCEPGFEPGRRGLLRRFDSGWRPGMFLWSSEFDWREWVWLPQFGYRDPDDPLRHRGWGEPMLGTSWRNRPFAVDWAFGGMATAGLTENARQTGGTVGGYRLVYDFDHYWGVEWRHLWASANLRSALDVDYSATTQHQFYDVSLLWYPWGDARWRPYAGLGLGMVNYDFFDGAGLKVDETMLTMPIAGGIKYYVQPWAILRLDLSETIVFAGSDIDAHAQFMATVGTEFRFGGKRTKYYPWETGWKP